MEQVFVVAHVQSGLLYVEDVEEGFAMAFLGRMARFRIKGVNHWN